MLLQDELELTLASLKTSETPHPRSGNKNLEVLIKKEMNYFESGGLIGTYLQFVFNSLMTPVPTSIKAERAFFAAGYLVCKVRSAKFVRSQHSDINNATEEFFDGAINTVPDETDPYASDFYLDEDLVQNKGKAKILLDDVGQGKRTPANRITREKTVNVNTWRRNAIKSRGNSGKQYTNWKNNILPERKIEQVCTET
ncbi:hypothetical protein ILUMI_19386 [Ignelater luminosus]|uniref:HAT C-terminal dimerisation domain-containing protein n=1 Tax=Ignelater luminosus TaxID=2038154 RepID=A0A8K0FZZ0_IGNLU|nr:hypothetical protein ILUMI_19386 [Ignelater luminosus]